MPTSGAISRVVSIAIIIVIILVALASGFGLANIGIHSSTFTTLTTTNTVTNVQFSPTTTSITYVQISGSNHSVFFVTEIVVVEPEVENEICVDFFTNTTVDSTYYLPTSGSINGTSPIGIVTTSTTYDKYTTTTLYENVTIYSGGTFVCYFINPHYNVTVTNTNTNCFCA